MAELGQAAPSRQRDGEGTSRLILREARQPFLRHGYRAGSTGQVAEACKLTQPALYRYCAGKEKVHVAVMQAEIARLLRVGSYPLGTAEYDLNLMPRGFRSEIGGRSRAVREESFAAGVITPWSPFSRMASDAVRGAPRSPGVSCACSCTA